MKKAIRLLVLLLVVFDSLFIFNLWRENQFLRKELEKRNVDVEANKTVDESVIDEYATITRVIDGDTVELEDGRLLRYIGINTPEINHPTKGTECFGENAKKKNQALVEGKHVRLEKDMSQVDQYDRLLRYVWLNDAMVNETLVQEGYAYASAYPPDIKYQEQLEAAQQQAREIAIGLWSTCAGNNNSTAGSFEEDDSELARDSEVVSSQTTDCLIKGNVSKYSGEKIYHVPGGYYYDDTVIGDTPEERWFCSEEEAVEAGWRKSKK